MMVFDIPAWERPLVSMAYEAGRVMTPVSKPAYDQKLLERAYDYCDAVTALNSRSFHLASGLLPRSKRRATRALYAFCRVTDDLVDQPGVEKNIALADWHRRVLQPHPPETDLTAVAWADARAHYHIPQQYVEQLINGVGQDLQQSRYATFEEMAAYSYGVASTVGLMSMHIIGFSGPEAIPYAVKMGVALQLTNILRDVAEDWQAGRLYLPQEELAAFGLTEADIEAGQVSKRWREFMRFQIERNRRLYQEAWPGIRMLDGDGRFAIAAAAGLYRAILEDIEQHNYDVFSRRAHLSGWGKLRQLPALWWRS